MALFVLTYCIFALEVYLSIHKLMICKNGCIIELLECGQKEKNFFKYNYFQLFFSNLRWTDQSKNCETIFKAFRALHFLAEILISLILWIFLLHIKKRSRLPGGPFSLPIIGTVDLLYGRNPIKQFLNRCLSRRFQGITFLLDFVNFKGKSVI